MFEWIGQYSDTLSVLLTGLSAIVWLGYLQILSTQLSRSRRPVILISRSAGRGLTARLFVSNMSAAPIYVTSLVAELDTDDATSVAIITDSDDISSDMPSKATNEGPLGSGQFLDVGTYGTLLDRVETHSRPSVKAADIRRMTLTVAASSGYSARLVGARRTFLLGSEDGEIVFSPEALDTTQITRPWARRCLRRRLEKLLRDGNF